MTAAPEWFDDRLDAQRVVPGGDHYAQHIARYRRANDRIKPGVRVLDAGSGTGYGSALLAQGDREVIGVDASRTAVDFAEERFGEEATFMLANVLALPFQDGSFDAVTCFEVIEHVSPRDQMTLVSELARILKPKGVLFLSTPNARMESRQERATEVAHWDYHVGPLMPGDVRGLLRKHFRQVTLYGQSVDLGALHMMVKATDVFGLRLLLKPSRRESVRKVVSANPAEEEFRFSRLLSRSATIVYAEAAK